MEHKFEMFELRFLFLDDQTEETENFRIKVEDYNRNVGADARKLVVKLETVNDSNDKLISELIKQKDINVFICDHNLDECNTDRVPNGLWLMEHLIKERLVIGDVLFILYTTSINKQIQAKLDELDIFYLPKAMTEFSITLKKINDEFNRRFPNRNFKAIKYDKIIHTPMDSVYYKYAEILEQDALRSPQQRVNIGDKEFTVQMLIEELRKRSAIGEKLVASYINALQTIMKIREKKVQ